MAAIVVLYARWLHISNPVTVSLTFLLVVLAVAAAARFWVAATTSVLAMLAFNFFFLPPVGTFYLADPQNWVALFVFLAVSLVASNLSTAARARAREAIDRQSEVARLLDLSRDVLLATDSREAITQLPRFIARRFALDYVAICLPRSGDCDVHEAGTLELTLDKAQLLRALGRAGGTLEFAAQARTCGGQQTIEANGHTVRVMPLRLGAKAIGLLAAAGRPVEGGTLDALAGLAAIAIERAQFLEERKRAELARQSEELKSALLASLGHDLRTPLTAIRIAASNLQASWLQEADRREQSDLILVEVERLQRLFQDILDMARIDAGAVSADRRRVHPSEIVEAARDQVQLSLRRHRLDVHIEPDAVVQLDPRLTAAALAHVLENAAQYSPPARPIVVAASVSAGGLEVSVRDHGPGIAANDLPHLFDRFYRGSESKRRVAGTGMGLSIARGLLAAEQGHIRAENCPDGGARFTIVVPAPHQEPASIEQPA